MISILILLLLLIISATSTALVPTPIPTPSPTHAYTYAYFNQYVDETCYGDVNFQEGILTNQCITYYTTSSIVTCNNGTISFEEYTTSDCTGTPLYNFIQETLNCIMGGTFFCKDVETYSDLILMNSGTALYIYNEY